MAIAQVEASLQMMSRHSLKMSRDALVVGINTDKNLPRLTAAAADAEAIAQVLHQQGDFQARRLPEVVNGDTLRVGQSTPVTLNELEEAIVQLFLPKSQQQPDTALFYFSGHGVRKTKGISEGFLATSDVDPFRDMAFAKPKGSQKAFWRRVMLIPMRVSGDCH
jgi:uncharacterized caspase-like protein